MEPDWTITELAAAAATALGDASLGASGRVREVPNERLIRWYTTIGLVDPPAGRRGRTALYGRRHLLQLVAIKRRQAEGRTIAQIQAELTGATDATLGRIARLSPAGHSPQDRPGTRPREAPGSRRFWTERAASLQQPAAPEQPVSGRTAAQERTDSAEQVTSAEQAVAPDEAVSGGRTTWRGHPADAQPGQPAAPEQDGPAEPTPVPGIRLAPGVTLLLDAGAGTLTPDDLAAIGDAAKPLLSELRRRALFPADTNDAPAPPPEDPALPTDTHGRSS